MRKVLLPPILPHLQRVTMKNPRLILSLNSKECLRASTPKKGLIGLLLFAWAGSWASTQVIKNSSDSEIMKEIKTDISHQRKEAASFESLTKKWEKTYGTRAFRPLLRIATEKGNLDLE